LLFDFANDLVAVAAEVTSGSSAVFLPWLQADPAEVILALQWTYRTRRVSEIK